MSPYGTGENTLAKEVLGALDAGMLCLADRGFFFYEMWRQALATKAQLLWRVKKNASLACDKRLADGSYLSRVYPSQQDQRRQSNGIALRVIEYRLQGVPDSFRFECSDAHAYRMIGLGVSVPVGTWIGREWRRYFS